MKYEKEELCRNVQNKSAMSKIMQCVLTEHMSQILRLEAWGRIRG